MSSNFDLLGIPTALACALMAGVYFAFSAFIMRGFAALPGSGGAEAMNAINRAILRSAFMPLFLASTLACLAIAVLAALCWPLPGSGARLAGGALYVLGMFGVTIAYNVPLNNRLAAAADDAALWALYLRRWTAWNHVRTLASIGAAALLLAARG